MVIHTRFSRVEKMTTEVDLEAEYERICNITNDEDAAKAVKSLIAKIKQTGMTDKSQQFATDFIARLEDAHMKAMFPGLVEQYKRTLQAFPELVMSKAVERVEGMDKMALTSAMSQVTEEMCENEAYGHMAMDDHVKLVSLTFASSVLKKMHPGSNLHLNGLEVAEMQLILKTMQAVVHGK